MKFNHAWAGLVALVAATGIHAGEIEELFVRAEAGEVAAQVEVAERHAKGRGVPKSPKEAVKWYELAATQGDAAAQWELGRLHLGGRGVPKNSTEAAKWFQLAAEQGESTAQVQMARMHLAGAGVVKDMAEAWKWAGIAAAGGDPAAKRILSFLAPKLRADERARADLEVQTYFELQKAADELPETEMPEGIPLVAPPLE